MKQQLIDCLDDFASGWRDEAALPADPMVRTARIQRWMVSQLEALGTHLADNMSLLDSVVTALRTGAAEHSWEDLWFEIRYPLLEPSDVALGSGRADIAERMLENAIAYGWSASRSTDRAEAQHSARDFVYNLVAMAAFQDNAGLDRITFSDAHIHPIWHAQAAVFRSFFCDEESL